jgi:hypothetical protein
MSYHRSAERFVNWIGSNAVQNIASILIGRPSKRQYR